MRDGHSQSALDLYHSEIVLEYVAPVTVPFLDLSSAYDEFAPALDDAWARVMRSGHYILNREVLAFEAEFAAFCGVRHCVGVGNGLDALRLLLEALGIGPADEVIVPAYTAVATWMAVSAVGAVPIGVDVEADSYNLDPSLVADAISERTRAIVAVHLFGRPADVGRLRAVADAHDVPLIEDAAQAHGAAVGDTRVGGLARAAAFSFYPTKNLGAFGDGGAVTTDDEQLAERVRMLRQYGWRERSMSEVIGWNSRLDELQAALLRVRLALLDEANRRRRQLAAVYTGALEDTDCIHVPRETAGREAVWHVYAIRTPGRDQVRRALQAEGIETLVHYDPLPPLTTAYRKSGWKEGDFPVAEELGASELSLPMYPQLAKEAALYVADRLREAGANA